MALFQKSVLNKYIKAQNIEIVNQAYENFSKHFLDEKMQEEISKMKEEEYQDGFLDDLFVHVLGYVKKPKSEYNLVREKKNETDGKKADGAILKNDSPVAVIELKGTDTKDLDKVTGQAFGYKHNHGDCPYVITSNFEKLRFFIHNAVEYIEFNLFKLSREDFSILWLCLQSDNLLGHVASKVKKESIVAEENITKQLYKDYATFKTELWQDVCNNAPQTDKLFLFKKTQKLLDRFLFIFFAEDSGLLPPNSISRMVDTYHKLIDLDAKKPLYDIFKQYFGYINKGRDGKTPQDDIFAYNGGLFIPDKELDNFKIDDELLEKHVLKLTAYDFQSEVDVNILGHIFENSLNEIENVTASLEGKEIDKAKTKRKKDGVFYTPKYITKYIIDNTLGKVCESKKVEFGIGIDEVDDSFKTKTGKLSSKGKSYAKNINAYRNWLLNIKVCDPSCGSGAFLNEALDFLIKEHELIESYTFELQKLLAGQGILSTGLKDVSNEILENNIYGVDINEESVEIAKLSLWLRTAQRGRKLTTLNNNIKCGNSLIDKKEVAGEKAFDWVKEFPDVFKNGGFDVIIGNPPYVRVQNLDYETIDYYKTEYDVCHQRVDLYLLFFEKSYSLLKEKGMLSFINPTMFVNSDYGIGLRRYLKNVGLFEVIDFGDLPIFADATTYTGIFTIEKNQREQFQYVKLDDLESVPRHLDDKKRISIDIDSLEDEGWTFSSKEEVNLLKKLSKGTKVGDTCVINSGCFTGLDEAFFVSKETVQLNNLESDLIYPIIMGKEPKRYFLNNPEKQCIYPYEEVNGKTELIEEEKLKSKYPNTYDYLLQFKDSLLNRKDSRKTFLEMGRPWYSYTRKGLIQVFNSNKVLVGYIVSGNTYCTDTNNFMFSVGRVFAIVPSEEMELDSLLGILNSSVSNYLMKKKCPIKQGGYFKISSKYLSEFTIPDNQDVIKINPLVRQVVNANQNLNEKTNSVLDFLESKMPSNLSKSLMKWYDLEFSEFLLELEKGRKKIAKAIGSEYSKLSVSEQAEWMKYFNEQKKEVLDLSKQISKMEKEINVLVYQLYGLTDKEVSIIEND